MKTLTEDQIRDIVISHESWLHSGKGKMADFSETVLRAADLSWARLSHAVFSGADMRHARLNRAKLSNCDFTDANMVGVKAGCADFQGADLTGAVLDFAVLDYATIDVKWKGYIKRMGVFTDKIVWIEEATNQGNTA